MAIEKNCIRVSRFDQELSMNSRESISSDDDDDLLRQVSAVKSDDQDDDDESDDADSGAGSDDFGLFELGKKGAEFCQIGNTACSVLVELYDLPGLEDVLSLDVWNNVLTEEEKFSLTEYLPDLDEHTFMWTLKELFEGANFHFGSPINKLFQMLKGGECEPRVAIYRDCLNIFQKRRHFHLLRKHQNSMVSNLCQIRDGWLNYRVYSIEEKLRVLHIMRTQKSLMHDKMEDDLGSDSLEKDEVDDRLWGNNGKTALKLGHKSAYAVGRNMEFTSRIPLVGSGVARYGKHNPKRILNFSGSKTPPFYGMDVNSKHIRSNGPVSWQNKAAGSDPGMSLRLRDQIRFYDDNEGDDEEATYEMMVQQDGISIGSNGVTKSGVAKAGKKHDFSRRGEQANDGLMWLPFSSNDDLDSYGRYREIESLQLKAFSGLEPTIRNTGFVPQTSKYYELFQQLAAGHQLKYLKGQSSQPKLKDNGLDLSGYDEPLWDIRNQGRISAADSSFRSDAFNMRSKKWKIGRESPNVNLKVCRASTRLIPNSRPDKAMKPNRRYHRSKETESGSSEQSEEMDEDDMNPLLKRKSTFGGSDMEVSPLFMLNSSLDTKHPRFLNKKMQEDELQYGFTNFPGKLGGFTDFGNFPGYLSKGKKGKVLKGIPMHGSGSKIMEEGTSFGYGKLKDEVNKKQNPRSSKSIQLKVDSDNRHASSMKYYANDRKQKAEISNHYMTAEEDEMLDIQVFADKQRVGRLGKRSQKSGLNAHEKLDASMLGGNSVTKKCKVKDEEIDINRDEDEMVMADLQQINNKVSTKKKGKRKLDIDTGSLVMEISDTLLTETDTLNVELEAKPQKKPYVPITPTVHTGFSFSVVHLLSAIRLALITPPAEDALEVHKSMEQNENCKDGTNGTLSVEDADDSKTEITAKANMPSLTIQEIIDRVRSNPGDPCILEMQEPLHDIVRGVLKIFSSRTAPLGAKGWKAIVAYEKSKKNWYWVGPVSNTLADHDNAEEVTSPEYWGIPQNMLVKLVDSFANWFKSGLETLQQIGSLPAPPISSMQCNLDEKERFRDLRAQKSLNTISPSSQEVRAYFQKEEFLRYSIPDRAFSYTAADGKKSIVAPLRRCGGKPTSKPRDHFMLKKDRPPHVTILCLVRDAAARLPGSIGTRADVCTLIRDSQYIVEDVSDNQVNQIVSGALDRLHYERDPCVQFDADRKLWVYLHQDREEEDFEDDGTSSTKKWKRQKNDPAEQYDQGAVTVAVSGTVDQPDAEMGSDFNNDPPGIDADGKTDPADTDLEDNLVIGDGCQKDGIIHQGDPVGVSSNREQNLTCQ